MTARENRQLSLMSQITVGMRDERGRENEEKGVKYETNLTWEDSDNVFVPVDKKHPVTAGDKG